MQNTFNISYHGNLLQVEQLISQEKTEEKYSAYLTGKVLKLQLKSDNEGALHWLDAATDSATEESKEIGAAIEAYLLKRKSSL